MFVYKYILFPYYPSFLLGHAKLSTSVQSGKYV